MPKLSWWKRALMVLGVVAAGCAAIAARPRPGLSAEPPAQAPTFQYAGSAVCAGCHAVPNKEAPTPFPQARDFIKLNESLTWKDEDKHSIAYTRLLSKRGQKIAELLKVDVTKAEGGCLNCHSASIAEVKNRQGDQYNPSEGVSCENCHGPYSGWAGEHLNASFRTKSPADWEKVGFNDLRSPDRQSAKCLSCHIGDSQEGKVVTHDMYAAGHPPLPSVEVATFADKIPRHWWLLTERKSPKMRQDLGYKEGQQERTKLAIVGAAVALRTAMNLVAEESKATGSTPTPGLDWPDYARFDCWSCHHDLKRESWRQARGYETSPGRPPTSKWPLTMVKLGIELLEQNNHAPGALRTELEGHRAALLKAEDARPFGQKDKLASAASALASWSNVLIKQLSDASYDEDVALQLLRKLVAMADQEAVDYDAARHIAWTIKILAEDSDSKLPNPDQVKAVIEKFDQGLKLNLPAGHKDEIDEQIEKALQVIGDYEPSDFRDHLKELAALIAPK